jgi:hypothetical protein
MGMYKAKTKRIRFGVEGDSFSIDFDHENFKDCEDQNEFEERLLTIAEEQASWRLNLLSGSISSLWQEVVDLQEKEAEENA